MKSKFFLLFLIALCAGLPVIADPSHDADGTTADADRKPFNPFRYQENADKVRGLLDVLAPVSPLIPTIGNMIPNAQSMAEISAGKLPSRLKLSAYLMRKAVPGQWLLSSCVHSMINPPTPDSGKIDLFALDSGKKPDESVEYCANGRDAAKAGKCTWFKGVPVQTSTPLSTTRLDLTPGHYTFLTLRSKTAASKNACYETVKITRTAEGTKIEKVTDPKVGFEDAPAASDYSAGWGQQLTAKINEQRSASGLRPLIYNPALDAIAYNNSLNVANLVNSGQQFQGHEHDLLKSNSNWAGGPMQGVVSQWMGSPGHRALVLNGGITQVGFGVVPVNRTSGGWLISNSTTMYAQ